MSSEWIFVGIFLILAIIFAIIPLVLSRVVAPRKPHELKHQTYECGMETVAVSYTHLTLPTNREV